MSPPSANRRFHLVLTLLIAFALVVQLKPASAETWRFALIGDTPYSAHERTELPKLLSAIADDHADLIVHIGDFKSGSSRCDDTLFEDRFQLFNASPVPFIYVPGDNEWTDCERLSNGAYDPLERMNKLRRLFWPSDRSLGQRTLSLERQPGSFPEHARFRLGPVLFVTLNIPGGNNNWGLTGEAKPEFLARNPVVLNWLKDSFNFARQEKLAGIVLLFQANPGFSHFAQGFPHRGYQKFLSALRDETLTFPGKVVAVHGDTHISRIDQPMRDHFGRTIAHFIRVETHGYPFMGWTVGSIDTDKPSLFQFEAHSWPVSEK